MAERMIMRENRPSLMFLCSKEFLKDQAEEAFACTSFPEAPLAYTVQPTAPVTLCTTEHGSEWRYPEKSTDVETVRQTMLQQEAVFKEQVYELHRLYQVQQSLMGRLERKNNLNSFPASSCGLLGQGPFSSQRGYGDTSVDDFAYNFHHSKPSDPQHCAYSSTSKEAKQLVKTSMVESSQQQLFDLEQLAESDAKINIEGENQGMFGSTASLKASRLWPKCLFLQNDVMLPPTENPYVKQGKDIGRGNCFVHSTTSVTIEKKHPLLLDPKPAQPTQNIIDGLLTSQTINVHQLTKGNECAQRCIPAEVISVNLMKTFSVDDESSPSLYSQEPLALFPCKLNEFAKAKGVEEGCIRNTSHEFLTIQNNCVMGCNLPEECMHHPSSNLMPSMQKERNAFGLDTLTMLSLQLGIHASDSPSNMQQLSMLSNMCSSLPSHPISSVNGNFTCKDSTSVGFNHASVVIDLDKGIEGTAKNTNPISLTELGSFSKTSAPQTLHPCTGAGLLLDLNADVSDLVGDSKDSEGILILPEEVRMNHEGEIVYNGIVVGMNSLKRSRDHDWEMLKPDNLVTAQGEELDTKPFLKQENVSTPSLPATFGMVSAECTASLRTCNNFKASGTPIDLMTERYVKDEEQASGLCSVHVNGYDVNLKSAIDGGGCDGSGLIFKTTEHSGGRESPKLLRQMNINAMDVSNSNSGTTCQSLDSGLSISQGKSMITVMSSNINVVNTDRKHSTCCPEDFTRDRLLDGGSSGDGLTKTEDMLSGGGNRIFDNGLMKKQDSERGNEDLGHDMSCGSVCLDDVAGILISIGFDDGSVDCPKDKFGYNELLKPNSCMGPSLEDNKPMELLDAFEVATLMLKPDDVDIVNEQQLQLPLKYQPEPVLKGRSKRRRMGKNFQAEMLPSITSLSRHEMNHDMQIILGILKLRSEAGLPSVQNECLPKPPLKPRGRVKEMLNQASKISHAGNQMHEPLKIGCWVDSGRRRMKRRRGQFVCTSHCLFPKM